MLLSGAAIMLFAASCNNTPKEAPAPQQEAVQQVDTAALAKLAGAYQSADGSKVINLKKDGTVEVKNADEFIRWEANGGAVTLFKKGLDNDVPVQVDLDPEEGKLTLKNEVFRLKK